jgi:hypothetical protein
MLKNQRKDTYQLHNQSLHLHPPPLGSPRFARGTAQGFGSPCLQVSVIAPTDAVIIEGTAQGFGSPCKQGEP